MAVVKAVVVFQLDCGLFFLYGLTSENIALTIKQKAIWLFFEWFLNADIMMTINGSGYVPAKHLQSQVSLVPPL